MTQNVRLQNLRDFTVQIRNASDEIVGTGIAVSTDGKIVTCAHVVQAALGAHPRDANGAEVGIYFPQARGGEEKKRRAKVECCFRDHDDDMVLLQLIRRFISACARTNCGAWNGGSIRGKSISHLWLQSHWKLSSHTW